MREMKWHIFNETGEFPLCWDEKALEFSSKENAERFLETCRTNSEHSSDFYDNAQIVERILFYDGGYLNADSLVIGTNDDGEEVLVIC